MNRYYGFDIVQLYGYGINRIVLGTTKFDIYRGYETDMDGPCLDKVYYYINIPMTVDEDSETELRVRYHEIDQDDKDNLVKIRNKCLKLNKVDVSDIKVYTSVGESLPGTTKGETVECKCDTDEEEV